MKVALIGSGGRLGAAVARTWRAKGHEILGFNHAALDLADDHAIRQTLGGTDFDVLLNCAAQTNVDRCETHPVEAMRINADAVQTMAELCEKKRKRCIHISTDYVFSGAKTTPYVEEDVAQPISVYGQSKRAGEIALLNASTSHLVVRLSWVFGPDRPSFVDGIVKRALTEEYVEAIADKIAVPTYTHDVADLLEPFLADVSIGGLLHLCNAGECSWQQYGQYAIDCAIAAGLPIKARTVGPLKMAELSAFIARRPALHGNGHRQTCAAYRKERAVVGRLPSKNLPAITSFRGTARLAKACCESRTGGAPLVGALRSGQAPTSGALQSAEIAKLRASLIFSYSEPAQELRPPFGSTQSPCRSGSTRAFFFIAALI
jgi:dTDP-4-dehydrorhamnose reductase